jgi:hypothetical protein
MPTSLEGRRPVSRLAQVAIADWGVRNWEDMTSVAYIVFVVDGTRYGVKRALERGARALVDGLVVQLVEIVEGREFDEYGELDGVRWIGP